VQEKLAELEEDAAHVAELTEEGKGYAAGGTPEERLAAVVEREKEMPMGDAYKKARLSSFEEGIALQWARKAGWVEIAKNTEGKTTFKATQKTGEAGEGRKRGALDAVLHGAEIDRAMLEEFVQRKLALKKTLKIYRARRTDKAKSALSEAEGEDALTVAALTPELLRTKGWKGKKFGEYDALAPSPTIFPGKKQPLREFIDEIREIFLQMGFTEIKGPIVEPAFWVFDALFVPQDHPGREMQDTFYVKNPESSDLSKNPFVSKVAKVHEDGGGTGSTGWGYRWSEQAASRNVLRTHTTSATCRHLAQAAKAGKFPVKVFCIDRVYRNEAIDYKHLAEFHQVEGIIIDDNCTFQDLVGTLRTFYGKLGFPDIRITPSYFPYTEPSAQVEVFNPARGEWMELVGCGMFRPELTRALGITQNVAAWGMGLERPLMLRDGLSDIRALFRNDLGWIRKGR
jgi:phenylalanyl-tRNA synthetase alpha chain